jgi:hypothetical protein
MWNTYATPVTRATVDEFYAGFSAFCASPRSTTIAVRQNTAFLYVLFRGIPIAMSRKFLHFFRPRRE